MLVLLNKIREIIRRWWSEFTLQTRLMAVATLVVSLLTSALTFWAVNTIQQDARLNDTRFGRDLGLLIASNVAPLVAENNLEELEELSERFYNSTSSVRYLLYADQDGKIFYGIPFSKDVQTTLTLRRRIQFPDGYDANGDLPVARQHPSPDGQVTDVFVPLKQSGEYLGVLAVGTNPNPTVVASSSLTRDVTIAVFVSIWVMVILGAVFNALTITKPIKELLVGVKNIATGNFQQRVNLPFGGELGELIVNFNDMAERLERYEEQNIEELTANKAKLETLVSTIADGAVLLAPNLVVVLANPTAKRILGWEEDDIIGKSVLYHLPPEIQVKLTRPLFQLAEGETTAEEFRITMTDPVKRTVRILLSTVMAQRLFGDIELNGAGDGDRLLPLPLSLYPELDEQPPGPPVRYSENVKAIAITVQDITREVELNEAKSQFISNVSHELRTPLFNIKSFIETLHEYGDDLSKEQQREFLATANNETDRLTRLVNDVLDLSRLESNRRYAFDGIDIAAPIEQTLRTCQLNARDRGITLTQEVDASLPAVRGNYDLLLQVFANLVGNALKFTEKGGKVTIRAYHPTHPNAHPTLWPACDVHEARDHNGTVAGKVESADSEEEMSGLELVRIEIADTGLGISKDDQTAIFDRFFRVENRVHTLEGTGLGLSIVRNIMEKHQSQVNLTSEEGVGTIFWFDLAVYRKEDELDDEQDEAEAVSGNSDDGGE
ncbi:MAG: ATP-binding protein [Cyanophyceae cyanobacterium]